MSSIKAIWKYYLWLNSFQDITMPRGSKILDIQKQGDQWKMWVMVHPEEQNVTRRFLVIGTGRHFSDENLTYIDTVQELDGDLVWHIFEQDLE